MRIFIEYAPAGGNEAAGKISGHVRTKVTVYLRTIRSGDNSVRLWNYCQKSYCCGGEIYILVNVTGKM